MTEKLSARQLRKRRHEQMLRAYEKNRRRNLLAQPGAHDFVVVLDHLKAGYNVPKIFRSAEAFGAREVQLIGIGPFDPSPAKGAFRQVPARFYDTFAESYQNLSGRGYTLYALSPEDSHSLREECFPAKSAFIFGHEEMGLSFSADDYPSVRRLHIPQYGRVESLNVSIVASIVMYEYTRQLQA
ncbi:TrmH family RNA methyltransferase [Thiolapillus sp.]|uniref:TrmH family RNA methyltransferase n=2 Tax=Thiolapillus sp. TaxID=2017437 RepID=UPI0025D736FC|nr:TrmH family RNA methyltransferase [Thiolapillus sp.]